MKNIYVLSTHKSSRLWINNLLQGKLELNEEALLFNTAQHLYITSDEEIKEGIYTIDLRFNTIVKITTLNIEDCKIGFYDGSLKKIILTTDQDLIADGTQSIDDEFLNWFVKNPSCEEVEVFEQYRKCCRNTDGKNENCIEPINCEGWLNNEYERPYKTNCEERFEGYKIIIPKVEPKPFKQMEKLTEVDWTKFKKSPIPSKKEEPKQELERGITITYVGKQETLEEAAEKLVPEASCELNNSEASYWQQGWISGHTKGAKWQQERSYSEEEVKSIVNKTVDKFCTFFSEDLKQKVAKDWFEQFKKK